MPPRQPKETHGKSMKGVAGCGWTCLTNVVSDATFPGWISLGKKSKKLMHTSKDIYDQRILHYDWTRAFYSITCEPEFSQLWSLHRKTENCNVFHLIYFQQKVMIKSYENSKKLPFGPFLHISEQTRIFLENQFLSLFSASIFLLLCRISEKTNEQILSKIGYRHTYEQTDTQTSKNS